MTRHTRSRRHRFQSKRAVILLSSVGFLAIQSSCALLPTSDFSDDPIDRIAKTEFNRSPARIRSNGRSEEQERIIHQAIATDEMVRGMRMDEVKAIWGQPREIETAGDPRSGNQRWIYPKVLLQDDSILPKTVTFEKGQVIEWDNPGR
jgi:hypothetical protein